MLVSLPALDLKGFILARANPWTQLHTCKLECCNRPNSRENYVKCGEYFETPLLMNEILLNQLHC